MSGNVSNHVWVENATKPLGGYWVREKGTANGAALVSDQGQAPSSYSGIVALSTTAASETIATGAKSVVVTNLDATAANYAILAFGETAIAAATNLASGGWTVRANSEKAKAVPAGAGGIAYKSAAGTPSIELTWG